MTPLLQNSPQMAGLRAFQNRLGNRHRQAGHDLERSLNGHGPEHPCWLDLSTLAYPQKSWARDPRGPESHTGNPATLGIYQTFQQMDAEGQAPDKRLLARYLTAALRKRIEREDQVPRNTLDQETAQQIGRLLQDAALQTLDTRDIWVTDALEYQNELDFHHAIWRACRIPVILQEDTRRGGPASTDLGTWLNKNRYDEVAELRTDALNRKFTQYMAGLHPDTGWAGEWHFTMEQTTAPGFRTEFQKFCRERLEAGEGRILPEDAPRLARRIVGDALCPRDRFTWNVVCVLTHESQRENLVKELLEPRGGSTATIQTTDNR